MKNIVSVFTLSAITGIILIILGFSYPKSNVFNGFIIIGICILLGIAIKTMDQLIDESTSKNNKIFLIPLAIFIPFSIAYLALSEEPVIGMVIGTVLGLLIAGKLDHPMYIVSVILFILLVFVAYIMHVMTAEINTLYIIPVAATGSFLDEFGHEKYKHGKITVFMFEHRFFLKIFAFLGFILGFAQLVHLIGFLCFDIFYDLIDSAWHLDIKNVKIGLKNAQGSLNE